MASETLEVKRRGRQFIMGFIFLIILIGGWHYPLLGYFIPLCMILCMGIAFFKGRKWCDWFCPRGSFYDRWIKPKKEIPKVFKGFTLRIIVISLLMAMMTFQIISNWPNPYKIGMFFVTLLTVTTIVGLILLLIFHPRTWCCFCPIGTMANWIGKITKKFQLKINSELCTECKACYKVCPIQIEPYKFKSKDLQLVKDNDCLSCKLCVEKCSKKALSL